MPQDRFGPGEERFARHTRRNAHFGHMPSAQEGA